MLELLALPSWDGVPRPLDDWADALRAAGHEPTVEHDGPDAAWIAVAALGLRGFAVIEGGKAAAINFELTGVDPEPATALLESAARGLGWEVHPDDDDADDCDDT